MPTRARRTTRSPPPWWRPPRRISPRAASRSAPRSSPSASASLATTRFERHIIGHPRFAALSARCAYKTRGADPFAFSAEVSGLILGDRRPRPRTSRRRTCRPRVELERNWLVALVKGCRLLRIHGHPNPWALTPRQVFFDLELLRRTGGGSGSTTRTRCAPRRRTGSPTRRSRNSWTGHREGIAGGEPPRDRRPAHDLFGRRRAGRRRRGEGRRRRRPRDGRRAGAPRPHRAGGAAAQAAAQAATRPQRPQAQDVLAAAARIDAARERSAAVASRPPRGSAPPRTRPPSRSTTSAPSAKNAAAQSAQRLEELKRYREKLSPPAGEPARAQARQRGIRAGERQPPGRAGQARRGRRRDRRPQARDGGAAALPRRARQGRRAGRRRPSPKIREVEQVRIAAPPGAPRPRRSGRRPPGSSPPSAPPRRRSTPSTSSRRPAAARPRSPGAGRRPPRERDVAAGIRIPPGRGRRRDGLEGVRARRRPPERDRRGPP